MLTFEKSKIAPAAERAMVSREGLKGLEGLEEATTRRSRLEEAMHRGDYLCLSVKKRYTRQQPDFRV